MRETKLKDRLYKAFDAFFENDQSSEQTQLEIIDSNKAIIINESQKVFSKGANILSHLFHGTLYFLGVSILFDLSIKLSWQFFGLNNNVGVIWESYEYLLLAGFLLLGSLFAVLGVGKINRTQDLSVPLSVSTTGIIIGILLSNFSRFFPEIGQWLFLYGNTVVFLPLGLVVGILAKNVVDSFEEDKID